MRTGCAIGEVMPENGPFAPAASIERAGCAQQPGRLRLGALLALVCAGYVAFAAAYSRLVPAWEANDEMDHVANVEHILAHRELVPLRLAPWHETHQPPLYYIVVALWQRALGIPAFTPTEPAQLGLPKHGAYPQLTYTHAYTKAEKKMAKAVHQLRHLSVIFGLATVALTYAAGWLATRRADVALGAAGFVAFLPKFTVISAAVTNDSLVVMLCSGALAVALWLRQLPAGKRRRELFGALALGAVCGAALLTKLNSIPVSCALLGSLFFLPSRDLSARLAAVLAAAGGVAVTCGWWIFGNLQRGSGPLGQREALAWLDERLPGLIAPVPWTDRERFLNFVPSELFHTVWYNGAWNQFVAPFGFYLLLWVLLGASLLAMTRAFFDGGVCVRKREPGVILLCVCSVMGLAAILIIAKSTSQAEGRVGFVSLSGAAVLAVMGLMEAVGGGPRRRKIVASVWPASLFLFNAYVFCRFVWPFRAL